MVDFYIRRDGNKFRLEENNSLIIGKEAFIFLKEFIDSVDSEIEVNFAKFGTLGKEMREDTNLQDQIDFSDMERLNRLAGKVIKSKKICYIGFCMDKYEFFYTIFHEISHFKDPYNESIDFYTPQENGTYYHDNIKMIKEYVRVMINEYIASYRAQTGLFVLIEETYKSPKQELIESLSSWVFNLKKDIDRFYNILISLKDVNKWDIQAEIIKKIFKDFIQYLMYFLGRWKIFIKKNYSTEIISERWYEIIKYVDEKLNYGLQKFLNLLKQNLLEEWKYKKEIMIRYFYYIFLRFFKDNFMIILSLAKLNR